MIKNAAVLAFGGAETAGCVGTAAGVDFVPEIAAGVFALDCEAAAGTKIARPMAAMRFKIPNMK